MDAENTQQPAEQQHAEAEWAGGEELQTTFKDAFVQVKIGEATFWRCKPCWEKKKVRSSHLAFLKRTNGTVDHGNLLNHLKFKHANSSPATSSASQTQSKTADACIKDQLLRFLAGTNNPFTLDDAIQFKDFTKFVRSLTDEEFALLHAMTSPQVRGAADGVTKSHREALLESLADTAVSILIDLGTVGSRTARRHEAFFFLASKDFVHFWASSLMVANEELDIDEHEWGRLVSAKLKQIVTELKAKNVFVIQILGDNASSMQSATRLTKDDFPWILQGRCVYQCIV